MSTLPDGDPARGSANGRAGSWRDRYNAARPEGVPLDPTSEPIDWVNAYPTDYAADHLLVTTTEDLKPVLEALKPAAADFGWGIRLENLDRSKLDIETATERAVRGRRELDLPTIYRVQIFPQPSPDRDDQPVPPIDAWRLLQRARARNGKKFRGVSLDHVMTIDPFGSKTGPFGSKTGPFGSKTGPFGSKTGIHGIESYGAPGTGGRQVVDYVGPPPVRSRKVAQGGRRPVVAILDTGCGEHEWLTDDIVTRYPELDDRVIGADNVLTDPELTGDLAGPFDGSLDSSSGHGTFIAGIVRQVCPEADVISVRVADSEGNVLEGAFLLAVRSLVKMMARSARQGGRQVDVMNLSLGYYHETPEDDLFDRTMSELLLAARARGCAVVCSAGNDATDRPAFPAALWRWEGHEFRVPDPSSAAPHLAVGARNPNGTVALFSNIGAWVTTFAPGASVLSTYPPFNGGMQPEVRNDRGALRRESIDPDDFSGPRPQSEADGVGTGFALWSGTSFAAPYVAAQLAAEIAEALMSGKVSTVPDRIAALRLAKRRVTKRLQERGPRGDS